MKKLLICGQLFTAETEAVQENMVVVLNDNKIEEIVPVSAVLNRDIYDEIIDLSDRFVMPGLFDCHTHVAVNGTFDELGDDVRYHRAQLFCLWLFQLKRFIIHIISPVPTPSFFIKAC